MVFEYIKYNTGSYLLKIIKYISKLFVYIVVNYEFY